MPSFISVCLRRQMRRLKPLINNISIAAVRVSQDKLGYMRTKSVASRVNFTPICMDGFEACFVYPNGSDKNKGRIILYLHGGGYVAGNTKYALGFASILAVKTNQSVLSIAYRLAPEDPFPAAVDDAFTAYNYLLENGYNAKDISLVGESAGGGLIYSLCLLLKQKGRPLPAALVGISPWTDLTFSGESYKFNRKNDSTLSERTLRGYAEIYAHGQENNPLVSPIFGDLSDLPPSLLFAGGDELLLDDAKILADRLKNSGNLCELVVEERLWHVYVLFKIPEANKALKKIAAFLEVRNE